MSYGPLVLCAIGPTGHWSYRLLVLQAILWNSMTSTSFVFTELANTMKYGGGFLYNLASTEWRHCASQNEIWGRGVLYNLVFTEWRHCVSQNWAYRPFGQNSQPQIRNTFIQWLIRLDSLWQWAVTHGYWFWIPVSLIVSQTAGSKQSRPSVTLF